MKSRISIFIFLLLYLNLFADEDIKIISSSSSSIVFEYTPNYSPVSYSEIDGIKYTNISFKRTSGFSEESIGKIELPYRNISLGVPSEFGNTLQVLTTQYSIIKGKIAPQSGDEKLSVDQVQSANREYQNHELVRFGSFGYSRDLPMQDILVSPMQYDPKSEVVVKKEKTINSFIKKEDLGSEELVVEVENLTHQCIQDNVTVQDFIRWYENNKDVKGVDAFLADEKFGADLMKKVVQFGMVIESSGKYLML